MPDLLFATRSAIDLRSGEIILRTARLSVPVPPANARERKLQFAYMEQTHHSPVAPEDNPPDGATIRPSSAGERAGA